MILLQRIRLMLRALFRRGSVELELDEELAFHLEREIERNLATGMTPGEARRQAMIRFGGVERVKEQVREARGIGLVEKLVFDLRHAVRGLRRGPRFTVVAVMTLAIAIGVNTAVFTLVNAILLTRTPVRAPEEMVEIYLDQPLFRFSPLSYPYYRDLRDATEDVFAGVAAVGLAMARTESDRELEMVTGEVVTGNYFPLLGVGAELGRTLLPEDDVSPGGHYVVMLSHGYWQRALGGDPEVVGRSITLSGSSYTIVGVAPKTYAGIIPGTVPSVIAPASMMNQLQPSGGDQLAARGMHSFFVKGRLKPGVTLAEARSALAAVSSRFKESYPVTWPESNEFALVPTRDVILNPAVDRVLVPAGIMMMALVGIVLLVACANLAGLLLARASERRREVAIRQALGAGRATLIRRLLVEALMLALMAGVVAFGLVHWGVGLVLSSQLPVAVELNVTPDRTVLAFTATASLVAAALCGIPPAFHSTRPGVISAIKDNVSGGLRLRRLTPGKALVVGQVAASVVLLVVAGLFARSLHASGSVDVGFANDPTAILSFRLPGELYTATEGRLFVETLVERARRIPGVMEAGVARTLHLTPTEVTVAYVTVEGVEPPPGRFAHEIDQTAVDGGFFAAAGIPLLRGRVFAATDTDDAPGVAVVNEAMAERFWPGQNALGRPITVQGEGELTVVGVVRTVKTRSLGEEPRPFLYLPHSQSYASKLSLLARTTGSAEHLSAELLTLISELDPGVAVFRSRTMANHLGVVLLPARASMLLSAVFAGVALTLAAIGLYGVVAFGVASRRQEMGIRMSVGARPGAVVGLVLVDGMWLVGAGAGLGLALALVTAQAIRSFLFQTSPLDPLTYLAVPAMLIIVALVATYLPARHATRIDPVRALNVG